MIRFRKGQPIPEGWELVRMRSPAEVESDMEKLRKKMKISSSSSSSLSPVDRSGAPTVRPRIEKNGTEVKLQEREEGAVELNLRAGEEKAKKAEAEIVTDENDIQFDIQEEESNSNPGGNMEKETETGDVDAPKLEEKSASNSIANPAEDSDAKIKKTKEKKEVPFGEKVALGIFSLIVLCLAIFLPIGAKHSKDLKTEVTTFCYNGKNHTGDYTSIEWTKKDFQAKECFNLKISNDRISSIDTRGHCILIFEHWDCTGRMAVISPDTPSHWDLHYYNLDKAVSSVRIC